MSSPAASGRSLKIRWFEVCLFGDGVARSTGSIGRTALTGLAQTAEASLRLDAGRLDDPRVFLDFAPHEYLEFLWRHVHGVVAQADEPVPHRRILQRLARVGRDLVHDPCRDARRAPHCEP